MVSYVDASVRGSSTEVKHAEVIIANQDAMGELVLAQLEGGNAVLLVEREDGWIAAPTGASNYLEHYRRWPLIERKAMRYVRGRVLDVGCGAGRHCLYLQEKDIDVVGIDISPLAVEVCTRRGVHDVRQASLASVNATFGKFDTVLMMGHNLGLLGGVEKGRRLLRKIHRLTTRKGRIIASTRDPYGTSTPEHLEYHELNRQRGRLGGQLRLRVRFRKHKSAWFDYLYASKSELEEIVEGTGWGIARFIDSDGPDYIAILEKSG